MQFRYWQGNELAIHRLQLRGNNIWGLGGRPYPHFGANPPLPLFTSPSLMILFIMVTILLCNVMVLLVGQRTCDSQVAGSNPGWAPLRSGLGQATYTCVSVSPSSIIWYQPRRLISLAGKVNKADRAWEKVMTAYGQVYD